MPYEITQATVHRALSETFAAVDPWFERPQEVRRFRPASGGWTIDEVLEHISLTSHFLLIVIRKHTEIAERRAARGVAVEEGESDLERLARIGQRGRFSWIRPAHMEPAGRPGDEVRATLSAQLAECLGLLDRLAGGKGSLATVRMTVDQLGKIDLYQWLYFLAQHASRHLEQMAANEAEWRSSQGGG